MKSFIALCVLSVVALSCARPEEYTDKYDNVNLDEVLQNKKLLEAYFNCIMDQGKCAPDAKELKSHIKEALENECGKCTETQKMGSRKVIGHLINKEPQRWEALRAKFDPENKYSTKYEKDLREVTAA